MSGAQYPYEKDGELLRGLSSRIRIDRWGTVVEDGGYVLHDSRWWAVPGRWGHDDFCLEIAGPSDPLNPQTSDFFGTMDDLVVCADWGSGLQFHAGVLLDVPWPVGGLIYVAEASLRGLGDDPDERVHGIFSLRFDEGGDSYYVPVDPEHQPGVASSWILYPDRDLVLNWRPVDVSDLLSRMEEHDAEV